MCEQNFSKQQTINPQIRVYVANLGRYNEGKLMGDWLNLPTSNNEIDAFLKNKVGLNKQYEEVTIHDFESDFNLCEYENLYDLNVLAVKLEQMSEAEKTLAAAYCDANGLKGISSILNTCEQINDLLYVELVEGSWGSKEEKLGYALLDGVNSDLKVALEQCKLGDGVCAYTYFDFEAYGRDVAINYGYFASDEFFIFSTSDIDPKLYTVQELKENLNDPRLEEA
ncbi:MAG: antirestriction protein ArdA [Candidatus Bathyarchaeota archaeon]|nr:antirestriction protein ArdA [Candidatus Termiticorpusculum sp.]MCL2868598.1 antirestriction protein ArdA [Candidatus Termiticorpusculum sp.]